MANFKGSFRHSLGLLALGMFASVAHNGRAALYTPMPKSRVDSYRVKSQYGPEIALLNPLFPKDNKVEISALGAWSPFSSLQNYWGYGGAIAYHIDKRHAIEPVWFQMNSAKRTNFVTSQIANAGGTVGVNNGASISLPTWTYAASYVFTPFYSKMHVTEMSVAHWDIFASAGFGLVKTKLQTLGGVNGVEKVNPGAAFGLGLRLLMPSRWGIRLDMRDFIHQEQNFSHASLNHTLQLSAGLSIFFSGFPDYTSL